MEKLTDYTCNPDYESEWKRLMAYREKFVINVNLYNTMNLEGFRSVDLVNPRKYPHLLHQAFNLRMRMVSYWKIVLKRFVYFVALHLQLSVHNLWMRTWKRRSPSVATKSVKLLLYQFLYKNFNINWCGGCIVSILVMNILSLFLQSLNECLQFTCHIS